MALWVALLSALSARRFSAITEWKSLRELVSPWNSIFCTVMTGFWFAT